MSLQEQYADAVLQYVRDSSDSWFVVVLCIINIDALMKSGVWLRRQRAIMQRAWYSSPPNYKSQASRDAYICWLVSWELPENQLEVASSLHELVY